MLKTHTLLGKALFTLADMDILLLVILLLSVAVICSGKLETNIARVCPTDSCFEIQLLNSSETCLNICFPTTTGEKCTPAFPSSLDIIRSKLTFILNPDIVILKEKHAHKLWF